MPLKIKSGENTEITETAESRPGSGRRHSDSSQQVTEFGDGRCAAGNLAVQQSFRSGAVQAKLAISQPNDSEEQEADRAAERVVATPAAPMPATTGDALAGSVAPKASPTSTELGIRRHAPTDGDNGTGRPNVEDAPRFGVGRPLDDASRAFMESRFGRELESVRIHTDGEAAASADALNARAYTLGRDIVFAAGEYQPESHEGRRLLAHELAHVAQQDRAARPKRIQRQPGSRPKPGRGGTGPPQVASCQLRSGTMRWWLVPKVGMINARIEFTPNSTVATASKTISFIQTVTETMTTRGLLGIGSTTSVDTTQVDVGRDENDPFYGAKWNPAKGKWGDEPSSTQARPGDVEPGSQVPSPGQQGTGEPREGSRPFIASETGSAVLNDSPMLLLNQTKRFETVAVVVETGQVLASLRWNIQCWEAGFFYETSTTFIQSANCVEGASAEFSSAVEEFYRGMVVLDGFAAGSADLPAAHPQRLASVVDKLKQVASRRAIVGGAATADEANPLALSRNRAERVKAYLVAAGIAASRIDVEAYGSDWARAPVTSSSAAEANRRVQITISQGAATQ
jgi:outer membrane protein OmpA-like peptidoglycan-associated protein